MAWDARVRRILCVRLDNLGDVLMTAPALRALKSLPGAPHLTLLTSAAGAAVAALLPEVDAVLRYAAPWMKASAPSSPAAERAQIAALAAHRFDAAVVFTVFSQSPLPAALLCLLAGIPRRLAHCRENPYQLLTDWVPESEPERQIRHEVRRQLDLVATVGARAADERLALRVPPAAAERAAALLADLGVGRRPWVAVHPGATAPSRRYPPEGFAMAADGLAAEGVDVVLLGAADEAPLVGAVQRAMRAPSHALVGRTDLAGLAGLLARAPVVVANNSGPAHVAAAVGTPVVSLYALTNPQHTPWGVPSRVLHRPVPCAFCYKSVCPTGDHACLRGVSPSEVVEAALALLRGGRDGARAGRVVHAAESPGRPLPAQRG